jgi:putative selenium metabolism hydrolase
MVNSRLSIFKGERYMLMTDYKLISTEAQTLLPETVEFLREIIAIPSPSGGEKQVIERVKAELLEVGFDRVETDPIGNLYGTIGSGKIKILYDCHVDTVGVTSPEKWEWDAFKGKYENGIVYGRGAADMKGAVAAFVYGGKLIKKLGLEGDYTLTVAFVVQEEDCEGSAIGLALKNGWVPGGAHWDFALLGEPSNLRVIRAQRGRVELKVVARGKAAHGSMPEHGINAVYKMMPVIKGIEELENHLPPADFLGKGSIAVSKIECQTGSLNSIPDECTIYIDRRLTLGETGAGSIKEISELPGAENAEISIMQYDTQSYTGFKISQAKNFAPWLFEERHPLVQKAGKLYTNLYNSAPIIGKWNFSTDGVYIAGVAGIPTIGFGPGEERYCHTMEEQVSEEQLMKAAMFYAALPLELTNYQ